MQKSCNSIADWLEYHLFCIIDPMLSWKKDDTATAAAPFY